MQKLHAFLGKNIRVYAIFNDQSFNDTLTNDFVSFEQLDQGNATITKHSFPEVPKEGEMNKI